MKLTLIKCDRILGIDGYCLTLNGYRIAGPKPWGGGAVVQQWTVTAQTIRTALKQPKETP